MIIFPVFAYFALIVNILKVWNNCFDFLNDGIIQRAVGHNYQFLKGQENEFHGA